MTRQHDSSGHNHCTSTSHVCTQSQYLLTTLNPDGASWERTINFPSILLFVSSSLPKSRLVNVTPFVLNHLQTRQTSVRKPRAISLANLCARFRKIQPLDSCWWMWAHAHDTSDTDTSPSRYLLTTDNNHTLTNKTPAIRYTDFK